MTYDFFANSSDKQNILDFIFNETSLKVFDLYSPNGQEITEYKSTVQIVSAFNLQDENHLKAYFNLWSEDFGGQLKFKRIELSPNSCNGHTFRYSTEGWGLIQLYFEEVKTDVLEHSHIGHFNEKGASKWENIQSHKGKVDAWNWKVIEQTSRKVKYHIHNKLAIRKVGTYGILSGADMLEKSGVKLWGI
ncbi:MAG: hypothetical protein WBC06_13545 [Chitinophagaceae bacterium]